MSIATLEYGLRDAFKQRGITIHTVEVVMSPLHTVVRVHQTDGKTLSVQDADLENGTAGELAEYLLEGNEKE